MSEATLEQAAPSGGARFSAALVASVGCSVWLALFLVLGVVVPEFLTVYAWTGQPLPWSTKALQIAITTFNTQWMWLVPVWFVLALVIILVAGLSRSPKALRRAAVFAIVSLLVEQLGACFAAYAMHQPLAELIARAGTT